MKQKPLLTRDMLSYGFLATPLAFASMPLYIHAPDYYATQHGLSLTALATLLLGLRFIDAVQDPFIGYINDILIKARVYIIAIASITLVISFAALFQPPKGTALYTWFGLFILLSTTAYSVLSININTVGGMWSRDRNAKTRIAGYREAFGLIGLLLAVVLPSVLQQHMPVSQAFFLVSIMLGVLMACALVLFIRWYSSQIIWTPFDKKRPALSLRPASSAMTSLYVVYALSMLASSIPAILVLFFIRDRLDAEVYTGLFLSLYFLSGAFGMPLWSNLSKRTSKTTAWMTGMVLAIVSFIWAVFLTPETAWNYGIICILSGLALGSDLAIPPSILADQIHEEEVEKQASYHYGFLTFIAKLSLAVATVATFPLLDFYGFKPGGSNSSSTLVILSITYAGLPSIIKLLAVGALWRWKSQTKKGASNVQNDLNAVIRNDVNSGSNHHV